MKVNYLDGGMIFELNKHYSDYGQKALEENPKLIEDLYTEYINLGSNYITTFNYGFKPHNDIKWEYYTKKSVDIMQKFRSDKVKVLGSIPPFFKSYQYNDVNDEFIDFYEKLIKIFKNNVDYYLVETSISYKHVFKIYEIIKKIDPDTKLIISLYPNQDSYKNINKYLDLDFHGLFLNCCKFNEVVKFYNENLRLSDKVFGFYCNKIDEKKYYKENNDIKNLKNYQTKDEINGENLKEFLNTTNLNEVFIGGCCGYGVKEMKVLIEIINTINF